MAPARRPALARSATVSWISVSVSVGLRATAGTEAGATTRPQFHFLGTLSLN